MADDVEINIKASGIEKVNELSSGLDGLDLSLKKSGKSAQTFSDRLSNVNERSIAAKIGITALIFQSIRFVNEAERMAESLDNLSPSLRQAKQDMDDMRESTKNAKEEFGKLVLFIESKAAVVFNLLIGNTKQYLDYLREIKQIAKEAADSQEHLRIVNEGLHQSWLSGLDSFEKFSNSLNRQIEINKQSSETDKLRLELTFKLIDSISELDTNQTLYNERLVEGKRQIEEYIRTINNQTEAEKRLLEIKEKQARIQGGGITSITSRSGNIISTEAVFEKGASLKNKTSSSSGG